MATQRNPNRTSGRELVVSFCLVVVWFCDHFFLLSRDEATTDGDRRWEPWCSPPPASDGRSRRRATERPRTTALPTDRQTDRHGRTDPRRRSQPSSNRSRPSGRATIDLTQPNRTRPDHKSGRVNINFCCCCVGSGWFDAINISTWAAASTILSTKGGGAARTVV